MSMASKPICFSIKAMVNGRVAKGIYGPSVFRLHGRVDVSLEPFVTKHHLLNDRIVV